MTTNDRLVEVLVPDHNDVIEALDADETIEAWQGAYWSLVVQIGVERTREHYPNWEDWIDEETGDVGRPSTDWNMELLRRFQARTAKPDPVPIIELESSDYDRDDMKERLKAMGVPNP